MPTYLCHGFRWHRLSILTQVMIHDLEDAAVDWIVEPRGRQAIIQRLHELLGFSHDTTGGGSAQKQQLQQSKHGALPVITEDDTETRAFVPREADDNQIKKDPGTKGITSSSSVPEVAPDSRRQHATTTTSTSSTSSPIPAQESSPPPPPPPPSLLPEIHLLEEYDPSDLVTLAAPWAYVADHVVRVDTSVSVLAEMRRYEEGEKEEQDHHEGEEAAAGTQIVPHAPGGASSLSTTTTTVVATSAEGGGESGSTATGTRTTQCAAVSEEGKQEEEAAAREGKCAERGSAEIWQPTVAIRAGTSGIEEGGDQVKGTEKTSSAVSWLVRLRDQLQPGERIDWYIVVCGDEDRTLPAEEEEEDEDEEEDKDRGRFDDGDTVKDEEDD